MPEANNDAKRQAVLAILAEVYGAGMVRDQPAMRRWSEELDQIYAYYGKHEQERRP
jgi:hypothetical protein